jgi:hypothetical protein
MFLENFVATKNNENENSFIEVFGKTSTMFILQENSKNLYK